MNPLFRIDFSISDSLKIVRKSVLIYETIIVIPVTIVFIKLKYTGKSTLPQIILSTIGKI